MRRKVWLDLFGWALGWGLVGLFVAGCCWMAAPPVRQGCSCVQGCGCARCADACPCVGGNGRCGAGCACVVPGGR